MIPGFVAGHYSFEECHIDLAAALRPLGRAAGPCRGDRHRSRPAAGAAEGPARRPLRPAVDRCRLGAQRRGHRGGRAMGDPGQADRRAGPALARVQRSHEELAGAAQRRGDRRRRGRRRAGAGDRPSAARDRQGGQPAGHARHQGRDPGRPGRGGAPQAARDLPAPRHPAARARRRRAHRARRGPARGRPMAAGRRGVRRHRGERRAVVRRHRPAARREGLSRRRRHARLDR